MPAPTDLSKSAIRPVVLALLKQNTMYGYEMVKLVNARTNGLLEWKEGTLYPVLHKLEADGLIRSQWQLAPETGKRRKYYSLTAKGKREAVKATEEWQDFASAMNSLMSTLSLPFKAIHEFDGRTNTTSLGQPTW